MKIQSKGKVIEMNFSKLITLSKQWNKEVCLFGVGECGSGWGFNILNALGFKIVFYVDNYTDSFLCNGIPVYGIDVLMEKKNNVLCIITVMGKKGEDILEQLKGLKVSNYYWLDEGNDKREDFPEFIAELNDKNIKEKFKYLMDDKLFLEKQFKEYMGYDINFDNPKSYNEKLNWTKLYDRNTLYTQLTDKYAVRGYVKKKIGEKYLIPIIGVWDNAVDIDFDALPNQFVLKCTHDSGSCFICKDKNTIVKEDVVKNLNGYLNKNYYYYNREWAYKDINPKIIAEKYMGGRLNDLPDYKFFCFNGRVFCSYTMKNYMINHDDGECGFFDRDYNIMPLIRKDFKPICYQLPKPINYTKMIEVAETLSEGFPHVRVDLYNIEGIIYFGEMTFYNSAGYMLFDPSEWDYILGDMYDLPLSNKH